MDIPLRRAGRPAPRLGIIASPYRRLARPLVDYVTQLTSAFPTRLIAVLLGEDQRVVLINVPWYLRERSRGPA